MSIHEVKVVCVDNISPHPNGDKLELIKIWEYTCVVGKGEFKLGDLAAYIEPDYVVDTSRKQFMFLAKKTETDGLVITSYGKQRITVKRLRGIWSSGLLIKAPEGSKEGDNVMETLGITRWEPGETNLVKGSGGSSLGSSHAVKGPSFYCPQYDLNNLRKYSKVLDPNEIVLVSAKIHGTNGRFCYSNGQMYCGSRTTWKKEPGYYFANPKTKFWMLMLTIFKFLFKDNPESLFNFFTNLPLRFLRRFTQKFAYHVGENAWWKAYYQNPWIRDYCVQNQNTVLYGEVYGPGIQGPNYHYGLKADQVGFAVFDILKPEYKYDAIVNESKIVKHNWVNNSEIMFSQQYRNLKTVPFLYQGPFSLEKIADMAESKETFNGAGHVREGVVVKLVNERNNDKIGRIALKYVSNQYLGKSE